MAQYDKLYRSQSNYLPLKSVVLFKDANQCDLDWDFLVGDICSSNELVYAMVEIEESNKKIKIVNEKESMEKVAVTSIKPSVPEPPKAPTKQLQQTKNQNQSQEKKVPEFKPTPIKPPTAKISDTKLFQAQTSETKEAAVAVKPKPVEVKKPTQPKKPQEKPVAVKEPVKKVTEEPIKPVEPIEPIEPFKPVEPEVVKVQEESVPVTTEAKVPVTENNIPIEVKIPEVPVTVETAAIAVKDVQMTPVIENSVITEPSASALASVISATTQTSSIPENVITPSPTPIPRTIFIPRKSPSQSSDSGSSDEEDDSVLNNFDATNLFGGPVIASEPRRSDPFVLFAAGSSSSEDEDDGDGESINVPVKCSSIVSLQAAPSSELDYQTVVSSSSSDNEEFDPSSVLLPQSVTLRRLSSVSPIPEPSEIPSLSELKESLVRAPTPSQIQSQTPKKQKNNNNTNNLFYNNKRGRPAKKQVNGRPKGNN